MQMPIDDQKSGCTKIWLAWLQKLDIYIGAIGRKSSVSVLHTWICHLSEATQGSPKFDLRHIFFYQANLYNTDLSNPSQKPRCEMRPCSILINLPQFN